MRFFKSNLLRNLLDITYFSGLSELLKPVTQGKGIIFMLHHILPDALPDDAEFRPNGLLEITPEFLNKTIIYLKVNGYEIISLGEAHKRIKDNLTSAKPFVVFTIDDGYLDNLEHAYPVFKVNNCPFTIYVTTDLIDHNLFMWWRALDAVIRDNDHIDFNQFGIEINEPTQSINDKYLVYNHIYWQLRDMGEIEKRHAVQGLCGKYNYDALAETAKVAMSWSQIKDLEKDSLVTIGAHSISHSALSKLNDTDALLEIEKSAEIIFNNTAIKCDHFCYPYGSENEANVREFNIAAKVGFKTGVTTQKGMLYKGHDQHLLALPRVSLNGDFQQVRFVKTYLSGLPFMLWNKFKKIHRY